MGATITDPLIGTIVDGRYEVRSRIARGGMATVYLAVDRRLDREVALKVMHAHLADGADGNDFVARFRREARAAARLTHPGLVSVYDQGVDGETSYLTMEYIEGTNLRRRIAQRGPLSVGAALDVLDSVLDALGVAHRAGLVHRDIKPENVLLATDGRTKLADFGLARAVTEVTATTTGTILGTVAYLGPELVSEGLCDTRTDVYAVGILCYEMLTGRQPFTGETPIQVAFQHVNKDVPAPSDLIDWLPTEVDELVAALAAREPDDRPRDATAALELVRRVRAQLDPEVLAQHADLVATPPPGVVTSLNPLARDESGESTDDDADDDARLTAVLANDRSGSTVALPIGVGRAEAAAAREATVIRVRDRRRVRWGLVVGLLLAVVAGGAWWYLVVGPGAYTSVPPLAQQTTEGAVAILDAAGLGNQVIEVNSHDVEAGLVIGTSPAPNARIAKDGVVTLTVSLGPQMIVVPSVVGFQLDAATAQVTEAGLPLGETLHGYDDLAPKGSVLSVIPEPGKSVPDTTTVTLTVSDGPAPVTVLSVGGATQEVATQDLQRIGLKVSATEEFDEKVVAGRVISQSPEGGSSLHRGDTVELVVSKGPELVEVPDVNRKQVPDATAVLKAAGFKVEVRYLAKVHPFDTVYDQKPAAKEMAPKGSTVVISAT